MRPIDYLQKMNKGGFISKLFNKPSKADIEALIPVLETTNIPSEDLSYVNIADELINSSEGTASEEDLAIQTFKRYLKMGPHLPKPSKPEAMGGLGVPVKELMKPIGKQEGGMVFETAMADNTAHSQMDRLIAENEINQMPRTPFSFLDRDRIDRESQELMDIAMSASMPMMGAMKIKKFSPKIMNMMAQLSKSPSYENNLLMRTLRGYNRLGSSKPTDEINIKNLLRYLESK